MGEIKYDINKAKPPLSEDKVFPDLPVGNRGQQRFAPPPAPAEDPNSPGLTRFYPDQIGLTKEKAVPDPVNLALAGEAEALLRGYTPGEIDTSNLALLYQLATDVINGIRREIDLYVENQRLLAELRPYGRT